MRCRLSAVHRLPAAVYPLYAVSCLLFLTACSSPPPRSLSPSVADNLVLITIDTLRADRVGAYGYTAARTPALDRLARHGVRFDKAYAAAPITLTSHASLLTGRYPPGHGARHNGLHVDESVPTLATFLHDRGFATGAFVGAFPLDRRFGLARGFDVYSDRMPRGEDGRQANERPGHAVVDEAITWASKRHERFFLWVHLFEPHAPYGDPVHDGRPAPLRYDEEIATADEQVGRLLNALAPRLGRTLVVVAGDHGESFGEHGEVGHSLFVYDTTLRVPLIVSGPGAPAGGLVAEPVCLVDVAPTVVRSLALPRFDSDGVDLAPAFAGAPLAARALYAESFAPLLDFGWSPLRSLREGRWKAVAAPRSELYALGEDPGEAHDLAGANAPELARLLPRIERYSGSELAEAAVRLKPDSTDAAHGGGREGGGRRRKAADADTRARLGALGYLQGRGPGGEGAGRPDPKDRRAMAADIERATSGEVQGPELLALLTRLAAQDPANGQVRMRLGYALVDAGRVRDAERHFAAAVAARVPSADPYLGLALCQSRRGAVNEALGTLAAGDRVEPGNPVVQANLGLLLAGAGRQADAAAALRRALEVDPDLHEARFNLALAYARAGRRAEAATQATELLARLPAGAPQRPEVERLLKAVR